VKFDESGSVPANSNAEGTEKESKTLLGGTESPNGEPDRKRETKDKP
jgi:hypothetical protein